MPCPRFPAGVTIASVTATLDGRPIDVRFVITRQGWLNLANDDVIRWRRVRPAPARRDQSPA